MDDMIVIFFLIPIIIVVIFIMNWYKPSKRRKRNPNSFLIRSTTSQLKKALISCWIIFFIITIIILLGPDQGDYITGLPKESVIMMMLFILIPVSLCSLLNISYISQEERNLKKANEEKTMEYRLSDFKKTAFDYLYREIVYVTILSRLTET